LSVCSLAILHTAIVGSGTVHIATHVFVVVWATLFEKAYTAPSVHMGSEEIWQNFSSSKMRRLTDF